MKVFLDANILFSATTPGGMIRNLVRWIVHFAEGITSDYALGEARKNLGKRYPGQIADLELLAKELHIINHTVPPPDVDLRAKDIPILVGAIASKATHLLTQDKRDFGPFFGHTIQGVLIITPDRLLGEIGQVKFLEAVAARASRESFAATMAKAKALDLPPLPDDEL